MMRQLTTAILLFVTACAFAQDTRENLGKNINTPEDTESYPCISPDGKTLFFSRQGSKTDEYDIMYSELDAKGRWGKAKPIKNLNNKKRNVVYNISPDGNTIILLGRYGKEPTRDGLSYSTKTEKGWSDPVEVPFERSSEIRWGNNACTFNADRNRMIISLDGNLHTSKWLEDKQMWSFPQEIEGVNSDNSEYTPFLAQDGKTLYFSSGGWGGIGSNDIFKSVRQDDTWLKWSKPENVGEPVNSTGWDSFFVIAAKGDYAYVYSLKTGDGDLFRIKIKEEIRPDPVVLVTGKVVNSKTGESVSAKISYENLTDGVPVGNAQTNINSGVYQIVLPYGKTYGFRAEADGYYAVSENLDLTKVSEYAEITRDLQLAPIEKGQKVVLNNIFFDVAKATLRPESFPELDRVAKLLKENPKLSIEIGGHTDSDGSDEANMTLSTDRAASVRTYLVSKGAPEGNVSSKGYGESMPIATNDTDEGKQKNRRVEFTILDY